MSEHQESRIDALIREIAEKNGIVVGQDDPILVLQTVNRRLLQESAWEQAALLNRFKAELEGLAQEWEQDARKRAERVLNASLAAANEATRQLMEEGARTVAKSAANVSQVLSDFDRPLRNVFRLAVLVTVAALCTLIAACMVFWGALR